MTTYRQDQDNEKLVKSRKAYKIAFWIMLIAFLLLFSYCLWENNKAGLNQEQTQIAVVTDQKDSVQKMFDESLVRLDSVISENHQFRKDLNIPELKDTLTASPAEKRLIRLIDSTAKVKDSINRVLTFMNDSIELRELPADQVRIYAQTVNVLAAIKVKMDLTLDNVRLKFLKTDNDQLAAVVEKFDKKREKLNVLSKRLKTISKFINITITVLAEAVSKGIIVAPVKT